MFTAPVTFVIDWLFFIKTHHMERMKTKIFLQVFSLRSLCCQAISLPGEQPWDILSKYFTLEAFGSLMDDPEAKAAIESKLKTLSEKGVTVSEHHLWSHLHSIPALPSCLYTFDSWCIHHQSCLPKLTFIRESAK